MDIPKPLPDFNTDYSEFKAYEVPATAKENGWDFIVPIKIDTYSGYNTVIPGIAMMLKVYFNSGLEKALITPEELRELQTIISSLDKAAEYEELNDGAEQLHAEVSDALLWIACNWAKIWL